MTKAPLEFRKANVSAVDFDLRRIDVVAVPYEQRATIFYRGELWEEEFLRGSFDGIEDRSGKIRVNREHRIGDTIGKITDFNTRSEAGLITTVQIARTPRGDETLALADDDMLSASIGFGVRGSDQTLDKANKLRKIKRAFLDHLAFVEQPAYDGAKVLSVRDADEPVSAAELPPLPDTPNLDELADWLRARRA